MQKECDQSERAVAKETSTGSCIEPLGDDEGLWTTKQTADYMGVCESLLEQDRYRKRGLPYVKFSKSVRYRPADVRAYIEAHVVGAV